MFSYLSSLVWGAQEETDAENASEIQHSTHEEAGEWLVVTTGPEQTGESASNKSGKPIPSTVDADKTPPFPPDTTSQESECDHESVLSDRSWVITPTPMFRATHDGTVTDASHPLENLLIEHPTMSVYDQVPRESATEQRAATNVGADEQMDEEKEEEEREQQRTRAQAQAREMVLLRNRQRYQVAVQLQVPPVHQNRNQNTEQSGKMAKMPLRVTRKTTRRHNNTRLKSARGRQNLSVKKCSFVAGRRRC